MSVHKAELRFSPEVWRIIEWFTYNFDTEIGALGKMKTKKDPDTGEKYFYVSELLFPQQYVTGATVHFTADMWGGLLKEHGLDGLKDVAFYWHRHPGNSAHSGTDDADTFETFMSTEANRKHFAFLQTAVDSSGKWNEEARIDIRLPVRHTIENDNISVTVEETPEDIELRNKCEAIAKKCIEIKKVEPVKTTYYQQKAINYNERNSFNYIKTGFDWDELKLNVDISPYKTLTEAVDKGKFGEIKGISKFNNDFIGGYSTAVDEKLAIDFNNGQATITAGKLYGDRLVANLTKAKGIFVGVVREYKKRQGNLKDMTVFNLQPAKKQFAEMKRLLIRSYFIFCDELLKEVEKIEYNTETMERNDEVNSAISEGLYNFADGKETIITGKTDVSNVLEDLDMCCLVDWETDNTGVVYDLDYEGTIGELFITTQKDKLFIKGQKVMDLVAGIDNGIDVVNVDLDSHEEEE